MQSEDKVVGKIIYIIEGNRYLSYHRLKFYLDNVIVAKCHSSFFVRIACNFRLIERLFRFQPRCVEILNDSTFVVSFLHKMWILDIYNRCMTDICLFEKAGVTHLIFVGTIKVLWGV